MLKASTTVFILSFPFFPNIYSQPKKIQSFAPHLIELIFDLVAGDELEKYENRYLRKDFYE